MLCNSIASAPPRRVTALLSLACILKKGEIKDVLYCTVLYCIVLYCIILYCIVLYCIVLYCIVLYCIVLYCIVLYCIRWRRLVKNIWRANQKILLGKSGKK